MEKYIREGGKSSANIKNFEFSPKEIKNEKKEDSLDFELTKRKKNENTVSPPAKISFTSQSDEK